jgi:hypothetical protein
MVEKLASNVEMSKFRMTSMRILGWQMAGIVDVNHAVTGLMRMI